MSDENLAELPIGKSVKKNKKRKKTSQPTSVKKDEPDYNEMLGQLKQKLEDAKARNDHAKANELRNQVWVLTDMAHGVRTNISEEELDQILEAIRCEISLPGAVAVDSAPEQKKNSDTATPTAVAGIQSNRLRNLQKKLDQIEVLKERQKKGEKLETNQIDKIKSEEDVRDEMRTLTEILSSMEIKH